ncbi:hypothetical protein [Streptomyces sp. NPDC058476]|uniref:hypothetical protein n=1 Tax=Streptomyces sp. NPDC058476 TaxID=3346519 RepID=UPI0036541092
MKTTMNPPVTLAMPIDAPPPAPGCGVCRALARQRANAIAAGYPSRATDCNIEIRNHPHPKHYEGRS